MKTYHEVFFLKYAFEEICICGGFFSSYPKCKISKYSCGHRKCSSIYRWAVYLSLLQQQYNITMCENVFEKHWTVKLLQLMININLVTNCILRVCV